MENRLVVYIDAVTENFRKALNSALSDLNNFGEKAEKAGSALSIGLSLPLAILSKKAVTAYGDMDAFSRGLATLEKNADSLTARLKELDAIPNLGFKDATKADLQLRTVLEQLYGIDGAANKSKAVIDTFNNSLKLVGKGSDEFNRAIYGIQQLANTEFPLGEDLNIIRDAIPQVTPLLNEAFGSARTEDLQKMKISSQQVIDTIVNGLGKLPKATVGIKSLIEQFSESIEKRFASVGEFITKRVDFAKVFDGLLGVLDKLGEAFSNLSPEMQDVVLILGGLAIALPPILAGLGAFITTILPALSAGFAALTGPIGLTVIAITAAAALIIKNWDEVKKFLVDTGVWDVLVKTVEYALGIVMDIVTAFKNIFTGNWGDAFDSILNITKRTWNLLLSFITSAIIKAIELNQKFLKFIGLDKLAEGGDIAIAGIKKLSQFLTAEVPSVTKAADAISNAFSGFTFGGSDRVVAGKKNGGGDAGSALQNTFKKLKEIQIKGFKDLEIDNPMGRLFDGKKIISEQKLGEQVGVVYQNLGYRLSTGASNLQKRLDGIQIKMPKNIISNSEEVARNIDSTLEELQLKYQNVSAESFKMIGDSIGKAIAAGMKPDEAVKVAVDSFEDIIKRIGDEVGKTIKPEAFAGIVEALQKAISAGMSPGDAFNAIVAPIVNMSNALAKAVKDAVYAVFDGFSELLTGVFTEAFGGGKVDFRVITGGLLSTLGAIATDLGKTAIAIGLGIDGIKVALNTLNPAVAIAAGVGLLALGAALKGAGGKIAGQANRGTSTSGSYSNSAPRTSAMALNVNMTGGFVIDGTQLKAVLRNTGQSWG